MTLFEHDRPVEVTGTGNFTIPARDSWRAVRFYDRVFGFRIVPEPHPGGTPRRLMRGRGGFCLTIDEQRPLLSAPRHLRFETADLDAARERLWNLGVALADGCVEPRIDSERHCRWLPLRDPDGNEIELVEPAVRFPVLAFAGHCCPRSRVVRAPGAA